MRSMQVDFQCPRCGEFNRLEVADSADEAGCARCDWSRPVEAADIDQGRPRHCLGCGCEDLWRQKDFSQRIGLAIVGLGILISTVFWYQMQPLWAIGTLMAFGLLDLVLYAVMPDVLVCYRCGARHRHANMDADHPQFDLEVHERYRQEAIRLEAARKA